MRSVVVMVFGLGMLCGGGPSQMIHAQSDGGIARLTSVAYGPDSPVQENQLFRYQTSRYGFAYNCDREEDKRNHPAISWQAADGEILPKRMGCLARVRHEVAQASRRILDGMCDTDGCNCKQQTKPACACSECVAGQQSSQPMVVAKSPAAENVQQSSDADEAMVTETVLTTDLAPATRGQSGLIRMTRFETVAAAVESNQEMVASDQEAEFEAIEYVKPPVARITSAVVTKAVTTSAVTTKAVTAKAVPRVGIADSHRPGLLERLKIIRSAQSSGTTKVKKF